MKKKVLLMGKSGSGKTSMRSIIFANYIARDTRRLGATIDVEHSHVRFLGNLVLNLWDCGGQESFMEQYFASQKDNIFRNVEVLIYVFDVESRELEKDMHYYQSCLEALLANSRYAKVFCLVHKMDLVAEEQRDVIFKEREHDLTRCSLPLECTVFRTSIWDETLYRAWSNIVYQLIPNVKALEHSLNYFANVVDADEVLLFERATFLVISHCQRTQHRDSHRFEKVSNIIKQFKLSCSKLGAKFSSMEVRNSAFAAFIDTFTSNTYVMVVMSDPSIPSEATLINIRNARKYFEELENPNSNLDTSGSHSSNQHLHHSVAGHTGHGMVNGSAHPNQYAGSGGGYHQYAIAGHAQQQQHPPQQAQHHLAQYQGYHQNSNATSNAYH
ncbi:ras-related GTP-binding protein A [Anopheles cruzii]|uniref:ras-related GTP-binding protein A n=1 Tax=Anopheles cruzii TaxID=68878 RepID=UPI0022EC5AD5|nr:ras-related GTP-binding protein A [Anopheles cruzii]